MPFFVFSTRQEGLWEDFYGGKESVYGGSSAEPTKEGRQDLKIIIMKMIINDVIKFEFGYDNMNI